MNNKFLQLILPLLALLSLATPSLADDIPTSGDGWSYNTSTLTLTISSPNAFDGGLRYDYDDSNPNPIRDYLQDNTQTITFTPDCNVTTLPDDAFIGFSALTTITLPTTLTSIGESAFHYCKSLSTITNLSSLTSLTSIGNLAFYNCGFTTLTLPNSVTSINYCAFFGCDKLQTLTLPTSLTSIGENAFYECIKLKSITNLSSLTSLTSLGAYAFYNCFALTTLTLPASLTSISESAFYGCENLESLTLPPFLTSISESAFSGCTALESLILPPTLESIGNSAFSSCTSLESLTLPDNLTSISNSAFSDCTALKSITLPASLNTIGDEAFKNCPVENLYIQSNTNLTTPHAILLGTNPTSIADYGSDIFTPTTTSTLHYDSRYTNIGTQNQNLRHYFTNLNDANPTPQPTTLQTPTTTTPAVYYDLGGRKVNPHTFKGIAIKTQHSRSSLTTIK